MDFESSPALSGSFAYGARAAALLPLGIVRSRIDPIVFRRGAGLPASEIDADLARECSRTLVIACWATWNNSFFARSKIAAHADVEDKIAGCPPRLDVLGYC